MDYIPAEDGPAQEWMTTYASGISANPGLYMLSPADATAITNAVNAYVAARAVTLVPATKTKVTVLAKDNARLSAEQICRQYAMVIKENAGIPDEAKVNIGVRPPNETREPITCPQSQPVLSVVAATDGAQTLRFADALTPNTGAKPFGAVSLQLFVAVAEDEVADPASAKFQGNFTKNPIALAFSAEDDQKKVTYFARWQSRKGETGPWSAPVSMSIAA
jgi:hypothetical protein